MSKHGIVVMLVPSLHLASTRSALKRYAYISMSIFVFSSWLASFSINYLEVKGGNIALWVGLENSISHKCLILGL